MPTNRFSTTSDDELLKALPDDDGAYSELISRYLPSIRRIAAIYQKSPADRDDLVSEGILGLMNAVRTYSSDKGASFSTYAGVCANNRMLNALKKQQRIQGRESFEEINADSGMSPEKIAIDREALREIFSEVDSNLTELEREVFTLYLAGVSYDETAKLLEIDKKSVDNALARVRRKLRRKFR